jgi:hypothetical protein
VGGRARNEGIRTGGGDHEAGEVARVLDQLARVALEVGVAVPLDRLELFGEAGEFVAAFGFDDADAFQADIEAGGRDFDALAVADEDWHAELLGHELAGSLDDARVGPFGEDDALRVVLEAGGEAGNQGHGKEGGTGPSVASIRAKSSGRARQKALTLRTVVRESLTRRSGWSVGEDREALEGLLGLGRHRVAELREEIRNVDLGGLTVADDETVLLGGNIA